MTLVINVMLATDLKLSLVSKFIYIQIIFTTIIIRFFLFFDFFAFISVSFTFCTDFYEFSINFKLRILQINAI